GVHGRTADAAAGDPRRHAAPDGGAGARADPARRSRRAPRSLAADAGGIRQRRRQRGIGGHVARAVARGTAGRGKPPVPADRGVDGRRGDRGAARRSGARARRHRGQSREDDAGGPRRGAAPHRVEGAPVQGASDGFAGARAPARCHSSEEFAVDGWQLVASCQLPVAGDPFPVETETMKRHMLTVIVMMAFAAAPAAGQTIEQAVQEAQERAAAAVQTINSPEFQQAIAAAKAAGALAMSQARIAAAADAAGTVIEWRQSERGRDSAQRAAEEAAREKERAQRDKEREGSYYEQGQNALDSGR